ncbi:MAG: AAA family ATPase [Verrucomicrobiota bacterium]|nr:AAA family ATPase [Verrucomicrobiota bacterium]
MQTLIYNELNTRGVTKQLDKVREMLENDDFKSAEIKKLIPTNYYRAKLDYENRLLFKFAKSGNEKYILLLEIIHNHEYEKSRFLNGAIIDDNKIPQLTNYTDVQKEDVISLPSVPKKRQRFHVLDKILVFDDIQDKIARMHPPLIIIGSAGSGKTVLSLEKLKTFRGDVLYVTHSQFLAENSQAIYYSNSYINEKQDVDFLSFNELLQTIKVPKNKEVTYSFFALWYERRNRASKFSDAHKLYEEFRGVLTGVDITKPYLTLDDYLSLGVKQSIFLGNERERVYSIFLKYLEFLKESILYDSNILAYEYQQDLESKYDYVLIDEIQDLTNIQINLILKLLKNPTRFLLCGDSNQIVHPNFFSWAHLKTMFYKSKIKTKSEIIRILHSNYRNSPEIIDIANKLLLIKNFRFGSIDKESNYLVKSIREKGGKVEFLSDNKKNNQKLNKRTKLSTRYAVIVPRDEDKKRAAKIFKTPLLFSIHEAKGLEYDNIILYNFISDNNKEYNTIAEGVTLEDLNQELKYARGKDKKNKSSEVYKFYINSFYVAITRAVKNIYLVESRKSHPLLNLLGLTTQINKTTATKEESSFEEWLEEARKLELQGKFEQAEEIRKKILGTQEVPWDVITDKVLAKLKQKAFDKTNYNKKAKALLCEYAALYDVKDIIAELGHLHYTRALNIENVKKEVDLKHNNIYKKTFNDGLRDNIKKYGINYRDQFNRTPLMGSVQVGNTEAIKTLLDLGADKNIVNINGLNSFQKALKFAFYSEKYAKHQLHYIYELLHTPSIKIKVDGQLIKLGSQTIEYFMFNLLMGIFMDKDISLKDYSSKKKTGFSVGCFVDTLTHFPNNALPDFRKKRSYLSSVLAKNEVNKIGSGNRKLFKRLERGYYILNAKLEVMANDEFINIYDLIIPKNTKLTSLSMAQNDLILMVRFTRDHDLDYDMGFINGVRNAYYSLYAKDEEYKESRKDISSWGKMYYKDLFDNARKQLDIEEIGQIISFKPHKRF